MKRGIKHAAMSLCALVPLLGLLLVAPLQAAGPVPAQVHQAAVPALPQDRLHFGLTSQPAELSWMTSSGVPWRYRYTYLSGGVNTLAGWETWNSPPGAYASYYMSASGNAGYIPVFSYYELLQSTPSTGASESARDFSNLNNAATMVSYYANFKLLMQMAAAYSKPVVVHVEPDLWGYLQQQAAGGAASALTASVASSGFGDAVGLPNTVQGFAWELLKLRDLYGPNAILAIHASGWASGIDINSSTDPNVSAVAVADSTAAFLNSAGIASNPFGSTWDLVFNDPDDHDAGWWEKQGANNASFTHWWDPASTSFPNFNRYLAWVAELKARTGRPQVAWQVPVGNQYFLTMNNTCGHYQDNVAAYFISHAGALFASGLIAVLFGAGNSCQTAFTDGSHDGVTNGSGTPTTDLAGYCNACNTHVSSVADDDGGYLRTFVGQYYGVAVTTPTQISGKPLIGDFDGNGKADLAVVSSAGVSVSLSSGTALAGLGPWAQFPFYGSVATLAGDVTGDGKADLLAVNARQVFVMPSTGSGFGAPSGWSNIAFYGTRGTFLADVNGDGRSDLVAVNNSSIWVMLSTGSGFGLPMPWSSTPFYGNVTTLIADVTGDGKADMVAVNSGSVWVMASTGTTFGAPLPWSSTPFYGNVQTMLVDATGDGKVDLVALNSTSTWIMTSTGGGFGAPTLWSGIPFYGLLATLSGDVNGDHKVDLIAINNTSVWVARSIVPALSAPELWL